MNNKLLTVAFLGLSIPLLQGCPQKYNIQGVELSSKELCNHDSSCLPGNHAPMDFLYEDFYFNKHAYRPKLNLSQINSDNSEMPNDEPIGVGAIVYDIDEIKRAASTVLGKITNDVTGGIPRVCDTYNGPLNYTWKPLNDPFSLNDYSIYNINHINFKKSVKNIIDINAMFDAQLDKIDKINLNLSDDKKLSDNELKTLKAKVKAGFNSTNDINIGFNAFYVEVGLSQDVIEKMFYGQDPAYKACLSMITADIPSDPDEKNAVSQSNNNAKNDNNIKFISGVGLIRITSMYITDDMISNVFAELDALAEQNVNVANIKAEIKANISQAIETNIKKNFVDSYKIVTLNKYYYKDR